MQIRIANETLPKGKRFQRIRLVDAIKLARLEEKIVNIPEDNNIEADYIKRDWKIHRTCRRCKRPFTVLKGYKREHVQLCQLCTELRKSGK